MPRSSGWNLLWFAAFLSLFVLLVAYVGPERVLSTVREADPVFLGLAFAAYASFFVVRGLRWKRLLTPIAPDADAPTAAALTAGGWLISTFVPFKAGDVARVALMSRRQRASIVAVGGTAALERALDVVGLAIASSFGLLLAALESDALPSSVPRAVALAWVLPLLGLAALFLLARWIPARSHENVVLRFAHQFLMAARMLRQDARRLATLVGLTVLVAACQVLVFAFLFHALKPSASWTAVVAGVPLFLLSFVIAVTPGQVGTYETAFVAVFALVGFAPHELLPMAVACHLLTISFVTVLGTIGFLWLRIPEPTLVPPVEPRPEMEAKA
jgi:uncharacterized protein (TIRG00374 family)